MAEYGERVLQFTQADVQIIKNSSTTSIPPLPGAMAGLSSLNFIMFIHVNALFTEARLTVYFFNAYA